MPVMAIGGDDDLPGIALHGMERMFNEGLAVSHQPGLVTMTEPATLATRHDQPNHGFGTYGGYFFQQPLVSAVALPPLPFWPLEVTTSTPQLLSVFIGVARAV